MLCCKQEPLDRKADRSTATPTRTSPSHPPTPPTSDSHDSKISTKEKQHLLLLQELIRRRLAEGEGEDELEG